MQSAYKETESEDVRKVPGQISNNFSIPSIFFSIWNQKKMKT